VRLEAGGEVTVSPEALAGRSGKVAVGIRPEKIQIGRTETNVFVGRVGEVAYVGVSTQYVVETAAGALTVYVQNTQPGAASIALGSGVELSFAPEAAFVVDGRRREEDSP
jgi:spermidine/putrescine transport system ATP-binding protein